MFGAARLSGPTCCCPLSSPWSTVSSVVPGVAASANSAWPRIMFGKLRTSHLLLIVAILAALWWITGLLSPTARQRTFREQLLQVDTASLGSFTIVPALSKGLPPLLFLRKGSSWELAMLNDTTVVDMDPVRSLLGSLANMRALRVAGSMVSVADRSSGLVERPTADRVRLARQRTCADISSTSMGGLKKPGRPGRIARCCRTSGR